MLRIYVDAATKAIQVNLAAYRLPHRPIAATIACAFRHC